MRRKAVLLVDDEESILESLGNYLERSGFNVETARSGKDALAAFSSSPFDLVITDLVMGGINGIDLLKEIKKMKAECGVFILTGQGNMTSALAALRSGADDFILKPCDADELVLKMERLIEKQDALKKIKIYENFLPICMYCKKIRDDAGKQPGTGTWLGLEEFLLTKSKVALSHGCCPECFDKQLLDLPTNNELKRK